MALSSTVQHLRHIPWGKRFVIRDIMSLTGKVGMACAHSVSTRALSARYSIMFCSLIRLFVKTRTALIVKLANLLFLPFTDIKLDHFLKPLQMAT